MLDIKHVRLLAAIERAGSLSGAARELGYSQPAVTQQVRTLQQHLRTPVVVRHPGGVRLTEAGQVILRRGRGAADALALAAAEVNAISQLQAGTTRIASFPSATATLIPPALGAVHRQSRGLEFTLVEAEPVDALELLRSGKCEIAIVYEYRTTGAETMARETWQGLLREDEVVVPILTEEVWVALPSDHAAAPRDVVTLSDLAHERWVAGCPSCRGNLVDTCASAGFEPAIAFETDDYVALQGLVAEGLGVALVPDLMLWAARRTTGLTLRPLAQRRQRIVGAVTTRELIKVAAVAATLESLAKVRAEPPAEPAGWGSRGAQP